MVIKDSYILKESASFDIKEREEITIDLELVRIPPCYHTLLIGKVLCYNYPVMNATVLILDCKGSPCYHTTTDEYGIYRVRHILVPGIHRVIVSAVGYHTSLSKTVYVCEYNITYLSFQMEQNIRDTYGVFFGQILEYGTWIPMNGVEIYLKSVECGKEILYRTRSNYNGFYLIYEILPNSYQLELRRHGFKATDSLDMEINEYDHINRNFYMYPIE